MPIYEYHCPHCRKNFEEWLKSDDDASTHPCPTCGESSPRIISQTTFILKGGGWYVTEYGSHHAESEDASAEISQDAPQDASGDTGAGASAADTGAGKDASGEAKSDAKSAAPAPDRKRRQTPRPVPPPPRPPRPQPEPSPPSLPPLRRNTEESLYD